MNLNPRFLDLYSIDYDYETILKNICNSSLYFWMNLGILHFVKQRAITLTQFEGHPNIFTVQQNACSEGNSKNYTNLFFGKWCLVVCSAFVLGLCSTLKKNKENE